MLAWGHASVVTLLPLVTARYHESRPERAPQEYGASNEPEYRAATVKRAPDQRACAAKAANRCIPEPVIHQMMQGIGI